MRFPSGAIFDNKFYYIPTHIRKTPNTPIFSAERLVSKMFELLNQIPIKENGLLLTRHAINIRRLERT